MNGDGGFWGWFENCLIQEIEAIHAVFVANFWS
jgi:hypothetical protein